MGALTPWRPFREMERWARNLEGRFPRVFEDWPFRAEEAEFLPPIESFVQNGNIVVRADVPGLEAKDIEVSVLGNVLTIKGERRDQKEDKAEDYIRREISYGSFERRLTLPDGADADKVKAQFKNGTVEITMPMAKGASPKKVLVESAEKK